MSLTTKPFKHFDGVVECEPPPLEAVPLHTQLARANAQHAKLTEQLRQLRSDWATKNIRAQQLRTPISTPEITFVEKRRRELHLALEATQTEIGLLNKEIKERKAVLNRTIQSPKDRRHSNSHDSKPAAKKHKKMPYADDPALPSYFVLAAKDTLAPALYSQVQRLALSLMHDARRNGVDQ